MLQNVAIGQYVPGNSTVHRLDPRSKLIFIVLFAIAVFLANSFVAYGLLVLFIIGAIWLSRISLTYIIKGLQPVWFLMLFTVIIHLLLTKGGEVYFRIGWFSIEEAGVQQAIFISLRLGLLVVISSLLTLTTAPMDLTDGLERLFAPLKKLKMPVHEVALMMSIALRFIPTLLEETDKIMKAQQSRGADFTSGSLLKRVQHMLPIVIPLFISSFRRAEELALAMEARGYRGGTGRTRLRQLSFTGKDVWVLIVAVALIVLLGWWRS
ncbi:energy-coupling factor transporter transmembrane protein EcfT [Brevibacillus fluminis]|uniref:Energy-coupling factor transporter transmembrane protein EcfT n=1 Tax=Brevibacillus fluminis TaxID=511487 RepID=A0A3M8CTI4_9BACL|nr:energy-coupling factor transporter transmembrane component T [Brevibacillus fluminis]RNB79024.1 energy-coupling factor transporter transmembrane protein EcfT [Brevibacillus fluminis]